MSSLVLLNREGVVEHKLQLVSLPDNFVIPDGMTLSWKMAITISSRYLNLLQKQKPIEAFFYLGGAYGQVCRHGVKMNELDEQNQMRFNCYNLVITVQGTSTKDVMKLRDYILDLIHSGKDWDVHNDLNPKQKKGVVQTIKKIIEIAKKADKSLWG